MNREKRENKTPHHVEIQMLKTLFGREIAQREDDHLCVEMLKDAFYQLLLHVQDDALTMDCLSAYVSSVNTEHSQSGQSNHPC